MNDTLKPTTILTQNREQAYLDFICLGNGPSMQDFDFAKLDPELRIVGINRQWERGIQCDAIVSCDEYQVLYAQEHASAFLKGNLYTRPMYAQKHGARTLPQASDREIGGSMAIRVAASFNPRKIILAGYDAHRWGHVGKWVPSPRTGTRGPRTLKNWHETVNLAMAENTHCVFIWANTPEEFALYCYA